MAVAAVERKDRDKRGEGRERCCLHSCPRKGEKKREGSTRRKGGTHVSAFFSVSEAVFHPPSGSAQLHRAATSLSFLASGNRVLTHEIGDKTDRELSALEETVL